MKKKYIKLNNNDNHLSLGNLFRIIKEISKVKSAALQTELFCTLFEVDNINDTTVNNYCIGYRSIGNDYKQLFINKERRYQKNHLEFADIIINLLSIIDSTIYRITNNKESFINSNESAIYLAKKLYNLAKNDKGVNKDITNNYSSLLKRNNIYELLVEELLFIILTKKQPIYEEELKKEVLENILNDTSISSSSLEEYLSLKLREGINYDYSMKELAKKSNSYANYELGCNEYYGYTKGYPRYEEAYKYLYEAAKLNHPSANYIIGNMYIKGLIGSQSKKELKTGYEYLLNSYNLGNIAASNALGQMYLNGIYVKKDIKKSKHYFKKAADSNYAYAFNNLGKIEENNKKLPKALEYYLTSANLGESWACNKVGEYYRKQEKMENAFYYYNKALDSNHRTLCYFAYYNLAKYFYYKGYSDIAFKDYNKAIDYLKIAADNNIFEALLELLYISINNYLEKSSDNNYNIILKYKEEIEKNKKYTNDIKTIIENKIKHIYKEKIHLIERNTNNDK